MLECCHWNKSRLFNCKTRKDSKTCRLCNNRPAEVPGGTTRLYYSNRILYTCLIPLWVGTHRLFGTLLCVVRLSHFFGKSILGRTFTRSLRNGSSHVGNIRCVPSSCTFSSIANPGGLVAISKSTPPGSRKYTE